VRVASLGSGSRGNATLVEAQGSVCLVDCGFTLVETERRLARLGLSGRDLDAVIVTHEHADHVSGVARLARRYELPVWMTVGTFHALPEQDLADRVHHFHAGASIEVGALRVRPFHVPHDAREPCQMVIEDPAGQCLGVLTDTGSITPHIVQSLAGCHALMLECNYDPTMLVDGPYPPSLKRRIDGPYGHLSNAQAAQLLGALDRRALARVVVSHVSEKNNTPRLALEAVGGLGDDCAVHLADQDEGLGWQLV
jgi:phosphoribosyl 1,2-cyclic phosphodiesterase